MSLCEAFLVTCEDHRLHQRKDGRNYVANLVLSLGVDCDLITRAGGVQDLLRPGAEGDADLMIRDMDVAHKLHQADMALFLNHEKCGGYKGFKFKSRDEEIHRHHRDIRRTVKMVHLLYPKKLIIGLFAELEPGTADVFVIKKVIEFKPKGIIRV